MANLLEIKDMTAAYASRLEQAGILTKELLLEKGASPQSRKRLAELTGIDGSMILRWINQADLARVKGIKREYADLLEAAGVDSVPELAQRRSDNLHQTLVEINGDRQMVRLMPTPALVEDWIQQAKTMPRLVMY
jgi:predicted flap endonuclease-1-like 5' DNA nuclease